MENRIFKNPWANGSIGVELARKENSLNLIAELDGKPMGYFFAHLVENEAHILNIALDVPFQNKGYGKQFLKKILDEYLQYADVFLEVKRSNFPAINLYLHFGFEEIDRKKMYYSDGKDAIIMSRIVNKNVVV